MPSRRQHVEGQYEIVGLHTCRDETLKGKVYFAYMRVQVFVRLKLFPAMGKSSIGLIEQQTTRKLEQQAALYSFQLRQLMAEDPDI